MSNIIDLDTVEKEKFSEYTKEQRDNDELMLKFSNISKYIESVGDDEKNTYWVDSIISDYDISKVNDERFQFYTQFMNTVKNDPRILKKVLKINNEIKRKYKKEKNILKNINFFLNKYNKANLNNTTIDQDSQNNQSAKEKNITIIDELIKKRIKGGGRDYISKYITDSNERTKFDNYKGALKEQQPQQSPSPQEQEQNLKSSLSLQFNFDKMNDVNKGISYNDNDNSQYDNNPIQKFIEEYYQAFDYKGANKQSNLKNAVNNLETSQNDVLTSLKITREDRFIFIIVTFFIRYITLNLVQWTIDINIVTYFYQGFLIYALIYNIFLWFIIMFVNASNAISVSYMDITSNLGNIKSIFYYFFLGTNGISRMMTHSAIIVILLLIPIIININNKEDDGVQKDKFLSTEERKQLLKVMSLLTMFIWIFTSIIAIKF